jgi:hypothetical protein
VHVCGKKLTPFINSHGTPRPGAAAALWLVTYKEKCCLDAHPGQGQVFAPKTVAPAGVSRTSHLSPRTVPLRIRHCDSMYRTHLISFRPVLHLGLTLDDVGAERVRFRHWNTLPLSHHPLPHLRHHHQNTRLGQNAVRPSLRSARPLWQGNYRPFRFIFPVTRACKPANRFLKLDCGSATTSCATIVGAFHLLCVPLAYNGEGMGSLTDSYPLTSTLKMDSMWPSRHLEHVMRWVSSLVRLLKMV